MVGSEDVRGFGDESIRSEFRSATAGTAASTTCSRAPVVSCDARAEKAVQIFEEIIHEFSRELRGD